MARPTKLTAALKRQIVRELERGAYAETAAEAAGIATSTLYDWLDRGARGEKPFSEFSEAVTRARARGELKLFADLRKGDTKGKSFGKARAAGLILERTRPHRYAPRLKVSVEDAVERVLEVFRGICSEEDFARALERLERLDSEGGEATPAGGEGADSPGIH